MQKNKGLFGIGLNELPIDGRDNSDEKESFSTNAFFSKDFVAEKFSHLLLNYTFTLIWFPLILFPNCCIFDVDISYSRGDDLAVGTSDKIYPAYS